MKVEHHLHTFPLPSETFIARQINGIIRHGLDVSLLAYYRGTQYEHPEIKEYELVRRCLYAPRMPCNKVLRVLRGLKWLLAQDGETRRRALPVLNGRRYGHEAWNWEWLYKAMLLMHAADASVVHCQFGNLGRDAVPFKRSGLLQGALVTAFRGHDTTLLLNRNPEYYRELFEYGDCFLPVSEELKKRLIAAGCPPQKTMVLRSGIALERFSFDPLHRFVGNSIRLLSVARLVAMKGIEFALDAVARLLRQGIDVRYRIIGDGPLEHALKAKATDLGIDESVCWMGSQSSDTVIHEMRKADILLCPSVTTAEGEQEGIPNVAKEAMALGLSVVATRHGGVPELVEDGVTGWLVPERDPIALASVVRLIVEHPEAITPIVEAARKRIECDYDGEKEAARLVKIYGTIAISDMTAASGAEDLAQ